MDIEEKIKRLGLLPVSEQVNELEAYYSRNKFPPAWKCPEFDYVIWHNGEPVFYSRKFLEKTSVEEIEIFLNTFQLRY